MSLLPDSPGWQSFRRNPMALIGLALVVLVVGAALFADLIAP